MRSNLVGVHVNLEMAVDFNDDVIVIQLDQLNVPIARVRVQHGFQIIGDEHGVRCERILPVPPDAEGVTPDA